LLILPYRLTLFITIFPQLFHYYFWKWIRKYDLTKNAISLQNGGVSKICFVLSISTTITSAEVQQNLRIFLIGTLLFGLLKPYGSHIKIFDGFIANKISSLIAYFSIYYDYYYSVSYTIYSNFSLLEIVSCSDRYLTL